MKDIYQQKKLKNLNKKLKNFDKGIETLATEPTKATKATKAKNKCKISSLKLREEYLNKIKNEE